MAEYQWNPASVAKQIASALSAKNDYAPVSHDQVIVEPTGYANRFTITIYDSPQAANTIIPLLDEYGSVPITVGDLGNCTIGYKTNRHPLGMNLRQHGVAIGGTTSGKTSLLRVMLLHALRCPHCFVWIGGTWKLYKFVAPLIDPFLNTEFPSPADWIAHGHQDVANMLVAWLDIGEYRSNLRESEAMGLPTGFLVLDEVTYIVNGGKGVKGIRNDKAYAIDELLSENVRGNAELDLWTWLATQHDTQFNLGDDGGTVGAQMMFKFIFAIGDYNAPGRVTNDFSLSLPTHQGECWVRPSLTAPLHKLRVPYPRKGQTDTLHNGPTMHEMVWNRRHIPHKLDAGSAAAAGEHYANRHGPYVTDDYIKYLTSKPNSKPSDAAAMNGGILLNGGSPYRDPDVAEAEAMFAQMVREQLVIQSGGNPSDTNPLEALGHLVESGTVTMDAESTATLTAAMANKENGTANLTELRTLKAQVMEIVKASSVPLGRGEIISELNAMGIEVKNHNTITNICGTYCKMAPPQMGTTNDQPPKYYAA